MWIWYMVSYLGNIPLQLNENVCHSNFTICETIHLIWTVSKYLMFLCISENPNCKTVVSKGLQNQLEEITHSHFFRELNHPSFYVNFSYTPESGTYLSIVPTVCVYAH